MVDQNRTTGPKLRPKKIEEEALRKKPGLKRSLRPKLDPTRKPKERIIELNSNEIDGKEEPVFDFFNKDGLLTNSISWPRIQQMWRKNQSGLEAHPGKHSAQQIMRYLKKENPTYQQFLTWIKSTTLNKGGLSTKNKTYNKGGMIDYRKTGVFK